MEQNANFELDQSTVDTTQDCCSYINTLQEVLYECITAGMIRDPHWSGALTACVDDEEGCVSWKVLR